MEGHGVEGAHIRLVQKIEARFHQGAQVQQAVAHGREVRVQGAPQTIEGTGGGGGIGGRGQGQDRQGLVQIQAAVGQGQAREIPGAGGLGPGAHQGRKDLFHQVGTARDVDLDEVRARGRAWGTSGTDAHGDAPRTALGMPGAAGDGGGLRHGQREAPGDVKGPGTRQANHRRQATDRRGRRDDGTTVPDHRDDRALHGLSSHRACGG